MACLLNIASYAEAQLPTADLTRITPRACRSGEQIEVSLTGQDLDDLRELRFTHSGITATPVLQPTDEFHSQPRFQAGRFSVSVAPDVPAGMYEVRAVGYFGYSTSRPFVVAPADSNELVCDGRNTDQAHALKLEVNSVVSGDVPNRGVHWFRFAAKKGQRVLIEVTAERIDSKLDSQLILYDSDGTELARNRDAFGRDSFLELQPSADGDFLVALSDILYRGGGDHFYRLSISTRPHIDFVWPPAGVPGSTGSYTVFGRNLPGDVTASQYTLNGHQLESLKLDLSLPKDIDLPVGHFPGQPRQGILPGINVSVEGSNSVRVGIASAPVTLEAADASIQQVTVPTEVAGRFGRPNDEDTFRFSAKEGTTYFVEVIADRMASPVDPFVIVEQVTTSEDGSQTFSQIAANDDQPTFFSIDGKDTINADTTDSALSFVAESDSICQVTIVNQFGDGSPCHFYRLAIREQTPDFQLIATTERPLPTNRTGYSVTPHLRKSAKWAIRIICPRQDNFDGDITVTAEDLPAGVSAEPLVLRGSVDRGVLVVSADSEAPPWAGDIRIVGRAVVGDQPLVREAKFAALVWGHIFADSIRVRSRLTEYVPLSVNGFEEAPVLISPAGASKWTVEVGSKLELPIELTDNGSRVGNLTIEPYGLHGMLRSPPTVNIAEKESSGTLIIDFKPTGNFDVKPGRYQFALLGTGVTRYRRNLKAAEQARTEVDRLKSLSEELSKQAEAAQKKAEELKAKAGAARQKSGSATTPEEAKTLKAESDAADTFAKQAVAESNAAAGKVRTAANFLKAAEKTLQTAEAAAAEKNTKFAAWSDLITVSVVPKADQ